MSGQQAADQSPPAGGGGPGEPRHSCERCGRRPGKYRVEEAGGARLSCLLCFLRVGRIVRRAALTAVVVGTVLTAINQGDLLLRGDLLLEHTWKIPLTYAVPYVVTTWGALTAARTRNSDRTGR